MAYPPKAATKAAFDEIKANPPKILAKTAAKEGPAMANKQRIAIGLSKARKASGMGPGLHKGAKAHKRGKSFQFVGRGN